MKITPHPNSPSLPSPQRRGKRGKGWKGEGSWPKFSETTKIGTGVKRNSDDRHIHSPEERERDDRNG
jgi:hypothetical protein